VEFVLEPLYKIYSHVLGEERTGLEKMLDKLGVVLRQNQYDLNTKELLRLVCGQFFGS